jgi:hypothetical protein
VSIHLVEHRVALWMLNLDRTSGPQSGHHYFAGRIRVSPAERLGPARSHPVRAGPLRLLPSRALAGLAFPMDCAFFFHTATSWCDMNATWMCAEQRDQAAASYAVGSRSNMCDSGTFNALQISNRRAAVTRFSPYSYF